MSDEVQNGCSAQFGLENPVSMTQVEVILGLLLSAGSGLIPYLVSETGQGKTTVVEAWAVENGYDLHVFNMVSAEASDLQGIPFPSADRKTFSYLTQGAIPVGADEKKVLLFLDEVNRAPNENKNIVFQLLNRHLGANRLGKNVKLVLAGNPSGNYDVNNITDEPAFLRRCVIVPCALREREALEHMKAHIWHKKVTEFLTANPDLIQDDANSYKLGHCFTTAGGWHSVSDLLYQWETVSGHKDYKSFTLNEEITLLSVISGILGPVNARSFWSALTKPEGFIQPRDLHKGVGVEGDDTGDKFVAMIEEGKEASITKILRGLAHYVISINEDFGESVDFHIRLFLTLKSSHWSTYSAVLREINTLSGDTVLVGGTSFNTWHYNMESKMHDDPRVHAIALRRLRVAVSMTSEDIT